MFEIDDTNDTKGDTLIFIRLDASHCYSQVKMDDAGHDLTTFFSSWPREAQKCLITVPGTFKKPCMYYDHQSSRCLDLNILTILLDIKKCRRTEMAVGTVLSLSNKIIVTFNLKKRSAKSSGRRLMVLDIWYVQVNYNWLTIPPTQLTIWNSWDWSWAESVFHLMQSISAGCLERSPYRCTIK